jgi:putative flippase GtrA
MSGRTGLPHTPVGAEPDGHHALFQVPWRDSEFASRQAIGLDMLFSVAVTEKLPPGSRAARVAPPVGRHRTVSARRRFAFGRRRELTRFAEFSLIGAVVFAAGTALQWALLRDTSITSDWSYVIQTAFSIELSFILNKAITWRDRAIRPGRAWLRWNTQRAVLAAANCVLYDWLVQVLHSWMAANVISTGAFIVINYAVGNLWSFARTRTGTGRLSIGGTCAAAAMAAAPAVIVLVPQARPLVYAAWLLPLAELAMLTAGTTFFRARFREAMPGVFTELIIQITTAGKEPLRVGEIITQIRGYDLLMPYQIWVVTEPGDDTAYAADRVLQVPEQFRALSRKKARALEYSRLERAKLGYDRPNVKIIFNDDDVTLTQAYIERAFGADYDVCEGVITPRTHYAVRPFGHFLISHADDIRTHACLVYCSVFQGLVRRPVHVHGEGMVITGAAEKVVTWNWDATASEDLIFGQRAVANGLRWGWFHEYAEVTSPWTVRDYLVQRRRWLWGDIHALRHRHVMPAAAAVRVLAKYLAGILGLSCSVAGLWLRATGAIPSTVGVLNVGKLAIIGWVALSFACGWIGAGSAASLHRDDDSRLLSGVLAVVMMPVSALLTFAAIMIPLAQGDPRDFQTIAKTRVHR